MNYYYHRFREKYYAKAHMVKAIRTNVGIKCYNMTSISSIPVAIKDNCELDPKELYLGTDFLKDQYTLLDIPLRDSPHYDFVYQLSHNKEPNTSEYLRRLYAGTLDWRYPLKKSFGTDYFTKKFNDSLLSVQDGSYRPVLIYELEGKYYIYDGKHRAAMCAMLGVKAVKCIVIASSIEMAGARRLMRSLTDDRNYKKHVAFLDKLGIYRPM